MEFSPVMTHPLLGTESKQSESSIALPLLDTEGEHHFGEFLVDE
jgi:hypothetical protein